MAAPSPQPEPALSLLDRLIDLDPETRKEAQQSTWERVREFQASLARDLTALLNTRRAAQDFDPRFELAANSLLTFGIVDFTSYNLKSGPEQEQLRRSIERAIRQFEPRLVRVSVSIEETGPASPVVRLQISAVLRTPTVEPVQFPVTVQRDSRRLVVSGLV